MISNFNISENENPNIALFRKLKERGILSSLQANIQNDFKEQQYVPQNAFTRANLSKILKITKNFKKNYLEPTAFKAPPSLNLQTFHYKTIGKLKYSTDSELTHKIKFEREDQKLERNQLKIINKIIKKKKIAENLPKIKAFYEKLILWLAKTKKNFGLHPSGIVTLLKSLQDENLLRENKLAIDDPIMKPHEIEIENENEEGEEYSEEPPHSGIIYPKFENIIAFFDIYPPNTQIVTKMAFNLIARENNLLQNHMDDILGCSFWKLKEIKRFFILFFIHFKKFDIISKKLQKNEQECRTLFRLTREFFGLKTSYKDIKRSKTKDISKEIIQEVIKLYDLFLNFS